MKLSQVFFDLARDPNTGDDIKANLAYNPVTDSKTLDLLSADKSINVRFYVAGNKNTHRKTLNKLSTDKAWQVREWVARNINTDSITVFKLLNDPNTEVRESADGTLRIRGYTHDTIKQFNK